MCSKIESDKESLDPKRLSQENQKSYLLNSSFLLLVERPGATSSVLAPRIPQRQQVALVSDPRGELVPKGTIM